MKLYGNCIVVFGLFFVVSLSREFHSFSVAADPLAPPAGTAPNDHRLQPPKDLNGYFPFKPPKTKIEWDNRSEYVRRQVLVSLGLWPMPTKSPLNAVLHGKIDLPEYTI